MFATRTSEYKKVGTPSPLLGSIFAKPLIANGMKKFTFSENGLGVQSWICAKGGRSDGDEAANEDLRKHCFD